MGKRIVLTTFGSYGDINPFLAIAIELRERGHRPVVATAGIYRENIEDMGVEFFPVRPDIDISDTDSIRRLMREWSGPEYLVRKFILPHLADSYNDLKKITEEADLILTHPITYAGPVLAEQYGLRWASAVIAPISFFSAHDPPVFAGSPWMTAFARLNPACGRVVINFSRAYTRSWMKPVYRLRKRLGLPKGKSPLFEGQYSPELSLALFPRILAEPQPDWPPNTVVAGYPFLQRSHEEWRMDEGLERFLDSGPPPIVFTLGSSAVVEAGSFYAESLEAARRLGRRCVLLTGPLPENAPAIKGSEDVYISEFAPHSELFPRCSLIVSSAGMGSISEGMRAGKPIFLVTFSQDQPDNADHARRLGISEYINRKSYRADRVVPVFERLLSEEVLAAAALAGEAVRNENGVARACDALESLLSESGRETSVSLSATHCALNTKIR